MRLFMCEPSDFNAKEEKSNILNFMKMKYITNGESQLFIPECVQPSIDTHLPEFCIGS